MGGWQRSWIELRAAALVAKKDMYTNGQDEIRTKSRRNQWRALVLGRNGSRGLKLHLGARSS